MRRSENIIEVKQIIKQKSKSLLVNRLADSLAFSHNIPCDSANLVWFLGVGKKLNNLTVLRTWMRKRLNNKVKLSEHSILQALSIKLRKHLQKVQNYDWV